LQGARLLRDGRPWFGVVNLLANAAANEQGSGHGDRGGLDRAVRHVDRDGGVVDPHRRGAAGERALQLNPVAARGGGRGAARAAHRKGLRELVGGPVVGPAVGGVPRVAVGPARVVGLGRHAVDREPALAPPVGGAVAVELGGRAEAHEGLRPPGNGEGGGTTLQVEPAGGGVGRRRVVQQTDPLAARRLGQGGAG